MRDNFASMTAARIFSQAEVPAAVESALAAVPVVDVHTHLFPPSLGGLVLSGIDDLLTYHYLEAELFRASTIEPSDYWRLSKPQRADLIWRTLFLDRTPLSETSRGVVTVLSALGLDPLSPSLAPLREFFESQDREQHLDRVFRMAGVSHVVMTNDPLDPDEASLWTSDARDDRFLPSLRLDRFLSDWDGTYGRLQALGYSVDREAGGQTACELRRYLTRLSERLSPRYMGASLPDSFTFPADDVRTRLLKEAVLPACRDLQLPVVLLIGTRRQVNPALRLAGDASGRADMSAVGALCDQFPDNRFMVSVLSRENQHELCVYARKFANLLPFGCWWFVNTPSMIEEITTERLELLGTGFIPQHSDARVLEQLIYKWREARRLLSPILAKSYQLLIANGRAVSNHDIQRDVERLFRGNFEQWTRRQTPINSSTTS